jgi:hypothetical protein
MARVVREHTPPTTEEVRRVRLEECRNRGHSFDIITVFGSLDPQRIICSRCGETWPIGGVVPTLMTVAQTLRQVAFQGLTDEDRDQLLETAKRAESEAADSTHRWGLSPVCPVCEETTCDEGCPLAEIRKAL